MSRTLKATPPKEAKPSKPKILVSGRPGVGKSWTALDFPGCYFIDCEGGANLEHYLEKLTRSGGFYLGPDQGANDFSVVTEEIITLATTEHPFRTLVIDSYSKIFNTQVSADYERMEKAGRDMEKTFGAEKKGAINWTRRWLRWFEKLDMNVILICHEKDKYKDGKLEGVTFDGWDKLEHELHLALNVFKQGGSRMARVAKTRLKEFKDAEVFEWSFESFAAKYGRDVIEAEAKHVEMSTPEQAKRYTELMSAVKVDPKIAEKWEENGGPEDLSKEDLQKRIDYLARLMAAVTAAAPAA